MQSLLSGSGCNAGEKAKPSRDPRRDAGPALGASCTNLALLCPAFRIQIGRKCSIPQRWWSGVAGDIYKGGRVMPVPGYLLRKEPQESKTRQCLSNCLTNLHSVIKSCNRLLQCSRHRGMLLPDRCPGHRVVNVPRQSRTASEASRPGIGDRHSDRSRNRGVGPICILVRLHARVETRQARVGWSVSDLEAVQRSQGDP
jgi:hypothetical protein